MITVKKYKLIGRTSNFQNFSESDFSKEDYYRICKKARLTLIKNKLNFLPINLQKIVQNNNWYVCSFKKAKQLLESLEKDLTKDNYGFTIKINRKFIIFYDDTIAESYQRFTIAHEIGHIVLNHFNSSNHVNDEKEANMFAARLLMPLCILYECNVTKIKEIQKMCKVSYQAAKFRFQRLCLIKTRNKFYTERLEIKVRKLFNGFIEKYTNDRQNYNALKKVE